MYGCARGSVGTVVLGDRGDSADSCRLRQIFRKQPAHGRVAGGGGAAPHYHADQETVATVHGGHEVEAGGVGESGLHAVDAGNAAEQVIMTPDGPAVKFERRRREKMVILREAVLNCTSQN